MSWSTVFTRRRWFFTLLLVFAINIWGLGMVLRYEDMGEVSWEKWDRSDENHDTRFLLLIIRKEKNPWKWFVSDWPLYNGFYRPLPTLVFELDNWLFYNDLNKYKISNWVIAVCCSFLAVWMIWEVFRNFSLAAIGGILFAGWQSGLFENVPWQEIAALLASMLVVYGFVYRRKDIWKWFGLAGVVFFLGRELSLELFKMEFREISYRAMAWPPGRTATVMTLFALISLAAYARFEREKRARWGLLSLFGLTGSFMSYEQSVVVAPAMIGVAIALHLQKVPVRWIWLVVPVLLTGVYLFLHRMFLDWSHPYHLRAVRPWHSGVRDMSYWLFPAKRDWELIWNLLTMGVGTAALLLEVFWLSLIKVIANVLAYVNARRVWFPALFGLLTALGTYSPMAFQHPLTHYFYFPMAFLAIFVAVLLIYVFEEYRQLA